MPRHGLRLLEVVLDAIGLGSDSGQADTGTEEAGSPMLTLQLGWKLKSVSSKYSVNAKDAGNIGLVQDTREDSLKAYRESGTRMFKCKNVIFAGVEDTTDDRSLLLQDPLACPTTDQKIAQHEK